MKPSITPNIDRMVTSLKRQRIRDSEAFEEVSNRLESEPLLFKRLVDVAERLASTAHCANQLSNLRDEAKLSDGPHVEINLLSREIRSIERYFIEVMAYSAYREDEMPNRSVYRSYYSLLVRIREEIQNPPNSQAALQNEEAIRRVALQELVDVVGESGVFNPDEKKSLEAGEQTAALKSVLERLTQPLHPGSEEEEVKTPLQVSFDKIRELVSIYPSANTSVQKVAREVVRSIYELNPRAELQINRIEDSIIIKLQHPDNTYVKTHIFRDGSLLIMHCASVSGDDSTLLIRKEFETSDDPAIRELAHTVFSPRGWLEECIQEAKGILGSIEAETSTTFKNVVQVMARMFDLGAPKPGIFTFSITSHIDIHFLLKDGVHASFYFYSESRIRAVLLYKRGGERVVFEETFSSIKWERAQKLTSQMMEY